MSKFLFSNGESANNLFDRNKWQVLAYILHVIMIMFNFAYLVFCWYAVS